MRRGLAGLPTKPTLHPGDSSVNPMVSWKWSASGRLNNYLVFEIQLFTKTCRWYRSEESTQKLSLAQGILRMNQVQIIPVGWLTISSWNNAYVALPLLKQHKKMIFYFPPGSSTLGKVNLWLGLFLLAWMISHRLDICFRIEPSKTIRFGG